MLAWLKQPNKTQIKAVKITLFALALVPILRLVWLGVNDDLSANPIEFIERSTGYWALFILMLTLAITPIKLITGRTWPVQLRRQLGLWMFFYVCMHITTYVWLDYSFDWADITKDIIKHPYGLVGFTGFVLSIPLAVTSSNAMMKRLRDKWKKLHQLVYVIAVLGIVHFWWLVKKDITEPVLFAIVLSLLFAVRLYYKYAKTRVIGA